VSTSCVHIQEKAEGSSSDMPDSSGGMLPSNVNPPPHVSLGLTGQFNFKVCLCCWFTTFHCSVFHVV